MNLNAPDAPYLIALTTAPSAEAARALIRSLVERRLVACGTAIPGATSLYWWRDAVEESAECVVILKTTAARWAELLATLPGLHTYQVPELVAVPIVAGLGPYLQWLSAVTGSTARKEE